MESQQRSNRKLTDVSVNIVSDAESGFLSLTFLRRKPQKGEFKTVDWSRRVRIGGYRVHFLMRGDELTKTFLHELARAYAGILPAWKGQQVRATNRHEFKPLFVEVTWEEFMAAAGRKEHKKNTL